MTGKIWENAVTPVGTTSYGTSMQNVERPDCHHQQSISVYMHQGRILESEQESIQAQLAQPCPECAKEKK